MLLAGKVAIIHGAGGSVGRSVSRSFASAGAHVVLCGRSLASLRPVLSEIRSSGGAGELAIVDALDQEQVDTAVEAVRRRHGRVDVSFSLVGLEDVQGVSIVDMSLRDFLHPIDRAMRSHFLTATAAARAMDNGGVILALTANCGRQPVAGVGGFGVACAAIAGLCRQLAVDLGPRGIRTICLLSAGSPDSVGVREVFKLHAANAGIDLAEFERRAGAGTMLGHLPSLADVAGAAVLLASDQARAMTGVVANVTCGEIAD
jgi:NAD(P)-dependent dehydrogenase (short-subunit alcohol dehydrogenase family)